MITTLRTPFYIVYSEIDSIDKSTPPLYGDLIVYTERVVMQQQQQQAGGGTVDGRATIIKQSILHHRITAALRAGNIPLMMLIENEHRNTFTPAILRAQL